jgi:hypothetical protein
MSDAIDAILHRIEQHDPLNLPRGAKPLDVFEAIYTNPAFPVPMRLRAARDAAQYVHAKTRGDGSRSA